MEFTVVIPTRNRPEQLLRCVDTVLDNEFKDFNVIVVDQGNSEDLEKKLFELARQKGCDQKISYIRKNEVGPAAARNRGIEIVQTELIAFIDDDCTAESSWLQALYEGFKNNPDVGIIMGAVKRAVHDNTLGTIAHFPAHEKVKLKNLNDISYKNINIGMTANCAVKKGIFEKIGMFDELYKCDEDWDLFFRALIHEIHIMVYPDAVVHHWGFRNWDEIIKVSNIYKHELVMMFIKLIRCGIYKLFPVLFYQYIIAGLINPRHRKFMGIRKIMKNAINKYWYCFLGIYKGLFLKIDKKTMMFIKR